MTEDLNVAPSPSRSETLRGLSERVAAASGDDSDSYLFSDVLIALVPYRPGDADALKFQGRLHKLTNAGAYLDAALELVERLLPGWHLGQMTDRRHREACGDWFANLVDNADENRSIGYGANPALALLSALLAALAAGANLAGREGDGAKQEENPHA